MSSLAGQTVVVTGGARGIGLGIAQHLARQQCRVVIWDRNVDAFDARSAAFEPAHVQVVDVADYASVDAALAGTIVAVERVDILVNNAGINGPVTPAWEYPIDAWERVIAVVT